jgi:hypothetical protein
MPKINPTAGDLGIIDHRAMNYHYTVVKVVKATEHRLQVAALQPDGSWGEPSFRKVDRFMFIAGEPTTEDLLAIREELILIAQNTMKTIRETEKNADALVYMMANRGRALGT